MNPEFVNKIENDPQFIDLVSRRNRYSWSMTALMLAIYLGFIFVIAFIPRILGEPLGGATTVGIPVGIFVILSAFVLTGVYVRRANSEFDSITKSIIERIK